MSAGRRALGAAWLVAVLLLTLVTLFVFKGMERFATVPVDWPADPRFEQLAVRLAEGTAGQATAATEGWQIEGDPARITVERGVVRLRNDEPATGIGLRQILNLTPDGPRAFRFEAVAKSEGIKGQRRGYRVGEISFVADDDMERAWFTPVQRLAALKGDRGPERFVHTFRFPSSAKQVELGIRLRHATGALSVRGIQLTGLIETSAFRLTRLTLTAAWLLAMAAGAWLFWLGVDHRRSAVVLATAGGAGLALLVLPVWVREATVDPLADLLVGSGIGPETLAALGHFTVFVVVGFLVRLARREEGWLAQLTLLVGLAGLSELLQYMAELRTPALDDWLTNALGALAGWVPAMLWLQFMSQRETFAAQGCSSTTCPPQVAKQRR